MMLFSESKLREYLAHYGADVEAWPDDARAMGRWALRHHPEFAALIEAEKRFERLLSQRRITPPHSGLSERIIAAAHASAQPEASPAAWFSDLLDGIRPASLAAMLILGFAIGFGTFMTAAPARSSVVQSFADDEGTFL